MQYILKETFYIESVTSVAITFIKDMGNDEDFDLWHLNVKNIL